MSDLRYVKQLNGSAIALDLVLHICEGIPDDQMNKLCDSLDDDPDRIMGLAAGLIGVVKALATQPPIRSYMMDLVEWLAPTIDDAIRDA